MRNLDIKKLRTFFCLSVLTFEFAKNVSEVGGGKFKSDDMYNLHVKAMDEVLKEEPNFLDLDLIIVEMERLAKSKYPAPNFKKGGISAND